MFEFLSPKRKTVAASLILFAFLGVFFIGVFGFAGEAQAGLWTWGKRLLIGGAVAGGGYLAYQGVQSIEEALGNFDAILVALFRGLADILGSIFAWVVDLLVQVAAYNGFLSSTAVITGWVIVRDICNMFFVIILLAIAIATILKVEAYSYKKLLPKLLLMAVLINFSKTICGIIIDFSQVIMLTFVNAFKAAAGANFWQAFGMNKMFSFDEMAQQAAASGNNWDLTGAALLAVLVILIATITVGVLMVVLVARVVVLWTLIILSPLAYLLNSFPQGQQYAKQWWGEFSKNVITGPVLAFFIWLALIVAGGGNGYVEMKYSASVPYNMGDISNPNNLSSLVVGITMLLVGLMFTKQAGVVGSGLAGSALSGLQRAGTAPLRMARGAGSLAWRGAKAVGKGGYNKLADTTYARTGVALPGSEMRADLRAKRRDSIRKQRQSEGMAKTAERMAGGRAFLASVLDPRAATKMSRWEMAKATLGGKEAQAKVRRASEGLAGSAADEMRAQDKLQGERLKQETEKGMAERQLKKLEGDKEFGTVKTGRVGDLTTAVTQSQAESTAKETEANRLSMINKFQKRVNLSDEEVRKVMIEDKAEDDLRVEKDRRKRSGLSDLSEREEKSFINDRKAVHDPVTTLADAAAEKVMMTNALAGVAPVSDSEIKTAQAELKKAKEKFDAATHSLETYNDRDNNPKAARADALARREAARERGDDAEVKKVNFELDELDAKIKIADVNNFFKMSYNEQVSVAKKSAEGLSESKLAKDIAAALKSGKISQGERDEVMKLWADKDLKIARERLEDILKKAEAAKTT